MRNEQNQERNQQTCKNQKHSFEGTHSNLLGSIRKSPQAMISSILCGLRLDEPIRNGLAQLVALGIAISCVVLSNSLARH